MATSVESFDIFVQPLVTPPLKLIADVFMEKLPAYFSEVSVEVVECPDLRKEPFNLTCEGLGGKPSLVSFGDLNSFVPTFRKDKVLNLKELSVRIGSPTTSFIGPSVKECLKEGFWGEGIVDVSINGEKVLSKIKAAYYNRHLKKHFFVKFPDSTSCCNNLADLLCSEGMKSNVLKVYCKKRKSEVSFFSSLRKTLENNFENKIIGLGGTFILKTGSAKCHVCRVAFDDPPGSATSWEELINEAVEYLNFSAPLTCIGTFITSDPDLNLRLEHFHCFNLHGDCGHFHNDTTPDSVEYLGYFSVAEKLYGLS